MPARLVNSRSFAVFAVAIGAFLAVAGLQRFGFLQAFELRLYDQYLRYITPLTPAPPESRVVLCKLTEADIREQGHWPISDRTMEEALRKLLDAGAAAVALDVYRDLPVSPGAPSFDRMLREHERIIGVSKFGNLEEGGIQGPPALEQAGRVGFNDITFDGDGIVRRGLLYLDDGDGEVKQSFALTAALSYLEQYGIHPVPDSDQPMWLRLGASTLRPFSRDDGGYSGEDDAGYQFLLDFGRSDSALDGFHLTPLLNDQIDPDRIRGKLVVVGGDIASLPDHFFIPVRGLVPGMEIHALNIDQLLRLAFGESRSQRVLGDAEEIAIILIFALLGSALGMAIRGGPVLGPSTFGLILVGTIALTWLSGAFAFHQGWWIPVVAPALSWTTALAVTSQWLSGRERSLHRELMRIFSRHVSEEVAEEIWRNREAFFKDGRPRAQRLTATVLFADMVGYSAQAEKMSPEDLLSWSNDFIGRMAECIVAGGGIVDDYFGDGIKANFGVPLRHDDPEEIAQDARNAVRTALAMAEALTEIDDSYRERGLPEVSMRIGVDTGEVVAGSIGSADRLKYTVVGRVAVTAQRLESTRLVEHDFAKSRCRILVSESTFRRVEGHFLTESVGDVALKGQEQTVRVHRILRRSSEIGAISRQL